MSTDDKANPVEGGVMRHPPEECRLEAHNTGDGWILAAVNREGEVVCYLAWPKSWPETMTGKELTASGFEVA